MISRLAFFTNCKNQSSATRLFQATLLLFLLGSCRSTVNTLNEDRDQLGQLDTEKGYLLIGVDTSHSLKKINIDGTQDIKLSHKDLRSGTNFILVALNSGEYEVQNIGFNSSVYAKMRDEYDWSFVIKAQTISYVGHLEVATTAYFSDDLSIELVNRSTEAIDFMQDNFPTILRTQTLYYGGPGEDDFFEFVDSLED